MKKLLAILLIATLCMSTIVGCGKKKEEDKDTTSNLESENTSGDKKEEVKEPTHIKIWYETQEAIAEELQKELDKLAPEIVVSVERKEKLTETLKLVGNDPSSAPDMYFFAHDKIGIFAEMGILSPITNFIPESTFDDFIPMTVSAATYKDQIYQLPIYFESLLFMYNKALMKEAPRTTDDLLAYMEANTKDGNYGFVEQHSTAYFTVGWIHAYDGFVINDKAEPGLDLKETKDAIKYHKQFVKYMPIDGDYNTMTTLFKEGKAHSTIGGPWLIPDLVENGIDIGIAPMPVVNETLKAISPFAGIQGICVLKGAESKKEAVAKVLEQLSKPDIGINLAKAIGSAPVNNNCYEDDAVKSNEIVMTLKKASATAVPMPNVPEMDVMWAITENLLSSVNKGDADPVTASDEAQKKALEQIEAMK